MGQADENLASGSTNQHQCLPLQSPAPGVLLQVWEHPEQQLGIDGPIAAKRRSYVKGDPLFAGFEGG